jgi:hypothetical protein
MLPRLKQVTIQPIEPKREPLAWEGARNAEPHSTARLGLAEEAEPGKVACMPVITSPVLQT